MVIVICMKNSRVILTVLFHELSFDRLKENIAMKCVPNPTETEYVFPWREITRVLFNSDMVARVGELGSSSTRLDRTKLERDNKGAESNVRSRKIDMLHQLYIPTRTTPLELVSWEAKSETASSTVLQCQLRKNIRINVSIQKQLQQYPDPELWTSPVVLDICGPKALAYTVMQIEKDLFVVGAVGDTLIELPRFEEDIHEFFDSGSLSALLRIGVSEKKKCPALFWRLCKRRPSHSYFFYPTCILVN